MYVPGLKYRCPAGRRRSVLVGPCLLIAVAGCERESPEVETPPETAVQLVLDTVNVVHSDLFHRVEGVRRLRGGDLAVMNAGSLTLRLRDSLGDLKETIGRLGQGPGEFQGMLDMDIEGDSIVVLDGLMRRVQLFRRDSFVTMWPLRGITGTPEQVAFSSGGGPVVAFGTRPDAGQGNVMRVLRETVELYRVDDPGTALETSVFTNQASPPSARMRLTTPSPPASLMSATTTVPRARRTATRLLLRYRRQHR